MSEASPRPRLLFVRCILIGPLSFTLMYALAGYTGVIRSEYLASPANQAVICGAIGFCNGLQLGLVIGVVLDILRWLLWKMRTRG